MPQTPAKEKFYSSNIASWLPNRKVESIIKSATTGIYVLLGQVHSNTKTYLRNFNFSGGAE